MEDLEKDELIQFINFYKQRSADLEFQLLQMQLKFNKLSTEQETPVEDEKVEKIK